MTTPNPIDASILKYTRRILKRVDRTVYNPSTSTPDITVYNIFDNVDVIEDATGLLNEWGEYVPRYADWYISLFEENKVRSLHITPQGYALKVPLNDEDRGWWLLMLAAALQ